MAADPNLSLTSLLLLATITFFAIRFFMKPNSDASIARSGARDSGPRVNRAAVEQVASMFPQLDRRAIAWDLQRNGGNTGACVERVLRTGRLDVPPPSYQPPGLTLAPQRSPARPEQSKPSHPDLITRYKLAEKLQAQQEEQANAEPVAAKGTGKGTGWSQNRAERSNMLQQRREAMILAARRKMEEKERREMKGKGKEVVDGAV